MPLVGPISSSVYGSPAMLSVNPLLGAGFIETRLDLIMRRFAAVKRQHIVALAKDMGASADAIVKLRGGRTARPPQLRAEELATREKFGLPSRTVAIGHLLPDKSGTMAPQTPGLHRATAHNYQDYILVKLPTAWTYYLAGRYQEAPEVLKGVEATHPWPLIVIYVRLGRSDEAKAAAAEWLKIGPHSVVAESCTPIREPMRQKYLDDLRKAGLPERATRASP